MNGTKLRSFSHFQILTKIAKPDLSKNFQIEEFCSLSYIHCKTVQVSQDDQIRM